MDTAPPSPNHVYPTRIRHNITIKPSARRRRSPQPSANATASSSRQTHTILPCSPSDIPQFPPDNIILHKDDSGSKVFLAIARSLLSVDNRATTVKDLADLAVHNGLGCQNSSAATQAITTYLRMHNDRCEADHDQPLLLSHNLSGTDADDDLIPALYSLQGGNPRKVSPSRRTNFRKNTAVWYLSRATGAPCPFARAGIRLCDYAGFGGEEVEERESKRRRSRHEEPIPLGQKRKRPLRSCVAKDSSDCESSENETDIRPQKKLTLRIRLNCPSLHPSRRAEEEAQNMSNDDEGGSSDDSMDLDSGVDEEHRSSSPEEEKDQEEEPWRLPPYPRRSISIPCYTPSQEGPYPPFPVPSDYSSAFPRSPSVTRSVGSLPPDSEDDDDFHISMTRTHVFSEESTSDSELESEDGETQFESPGPRSPSAPLIPPQAHVTVKEEPRDLQGMLDAWDDFDSSHAETKVASTEPGQLKVNPESFDLWDWDSSKEQWAESPRVKQEDLSFDTLFSPSALLPPPSPPPSCNAFDSSPSRRPEDEDWNDSQRNMGTIGPRSKTVPALASYQTLASGPPSLSVPPPSSRSNSIPAANAESANIQPYSPSSTNLTQSIASLMQSMNSLCSSGVSPSSLVLAPTNRLGPNIVLVHTCQPCNPPVTATQIEDISVYQMVLGNFHFLRRIDTDFVNLSPIVTYLQDPFPVLSTVPNATVINKGSSSVVGIWVPLAVAQVYLKDHPAKDNEFDTFLSDELFERFPTALQDFHRSNAPGRMLSQFGRHFGSTLQVSHAQQQQQVMSIVTAAEMLARQQHAANNPLVVVPTSTSDAYTLSASMAAAVEKQNENVEVPLSATEREIFDLCVVPDWDKDSAPSTATLPASSLVEDDGMGKEEVEDTGDDADVSDTSSLTSISSSSREAPSPSRFSTNSPSPCVSPRGTAMEGVVEVQADPSCAQGRAAVSCNKSSGTPGEDGSRSNRPLRRSKRVADLAASHHIPAPTSASSNARTRTRGGRGSRNSIS